MKMNWTRIWENTISLFFASLPFMITVIAIVVIIVLGNIPEGYQGRIEFLEDRAQTVYDMAVDNKNQIKLFIDNHREFFQITKGMILEQNKQVEQIEILRTQMGQLRNEYNNHRHIGIYGKIK